MANKAKQTPGFDIEALIPPEWKAEEYINRTIEGVRDVDVLDSARRMKANVLLFGPTGPGKTSCVQAYCAEKRIPYYSIPCHQSIEPRQLVGSYIPTETAGVYRWQDGPVTALARFGGVLELEEVNFMPRGISSFLNPVLRGRVLSVLEHSGEVIPVHDDFQIIATMNPDYEGTKPLNEAFRNRFSLKLKFDYDREIEEQLVSLTSLLDLADQLRASHGTTLETPVSTNMLIEFEDLAFEFSFAFAVENFLNAFTESERNAVREVVKLREADLKNEWDALMKGDGDDES